MILTNTIKINITSRNINYYKNYIDDIKTGDTKSIDIKILHKGSNLIVDVKCDTCGKLSKVRYNRYNQYIKKDKKFYCINCKHIKTKITNLERYGVECNLQNEEIKKVVKQKFIDKYGLDNPTKNDSIKNKIKNTVNQKYNCDNVFQINETKEKIKITNLKKYGVSYPQQNQLIREKTIKSNLDKFNVETTFDSSVIKNKIKKRLIEKYDVDNVFKNSETRNKFEIKNKISWFNRVKEKYKNLNFLNVDYIKKEFQINCDRGHLFNITFGLFYNRNRKNNKTEICTICNPINKQESGKEIQVRNFIKENYKGRIVLKNKKLISPYEIDVYLPDLKIGFEFNGLYWHSEIYKNKNYHINKTNLADKNGIKLIQIYEDDWIYKQDIVKSIISNLIGKSNQIISSECEIKEIYDNKLIKEFLIENHIQGFIYSKIKIGLFYNDELVSLMIFKNIKKSIDNSYGILRFCNKLNIDVIDSASLLFKYFVEHYKPFEIISYVNRNLDNGNIYEEMGFKLIHKTQPNYYYIVDGMRKRKNNFKNDKTKHETLLEREIFKIYDSGNLIYFYKKF